ncbi:MAG TPA: hypothetical protein VFW68_14125 [Rhodocyclaceae bacterium]|nr:hypothetical protein [Rhodocyclaceae bacterium]
MKRPATALSLCVLAATGVLAACDKGTPTPRPLTAAERAASLVEVIEHRDECKSIRKRLSDPNPDAKTVDDLYREAVSTKCLEKDV